MKIIQHVEEARQGLLEGHIIAHPTEAVYGLGCDPFNKAAVERLLILKQRSMNKGLILLISDWAQLEALISPVSEQLLAPVRATWPGFVTWLFPKSALIPHWLSGDHPSIAIRMTAHPVARALCADGPVVSTSANVSGQTPIVDLAECRLQFPTGINGFLVGELGGAKEPSAIYSLVSGKQLR